MQIIACKYLCLQFSRRLTESSYIASIVFMLSLWDSSVWNKIKISHHVDSSIRSTSLNQGLLYCSCRYHNPLKILLMRFLDKRPFERNKRAPSSKWPSLKWSSLKWSSSKWSSFHYFIFHVTQWLESMAIFSDVRW